MPTPTPTVHTHSNSALRRGRIELRATALRRGRIELRATSHKVIRQSRKAHNSPDKAAKVIFCRTTVFHTLGKHSTRPHDTTRSNLTGSRSRRAGRSEGAAQKSALYRDQRLFAVTARIDPVATGLRRSARSIRSDDERDGFRPLDSADQAAPARNEVPQLLMPVESLAGAADRPVGAAEASSVSPRPLTHTQTAQHDQTRRPVPT